MKSYTWRSAILRSELEPTTRHVLLTLSCHVNDAGDAAFPSTRTLAVETGLSERAVVTHIKKAVDANWLEVQRHGYGDRKWRRNEYYPRLPDEIYAEPLDHDEPTYASTVQRRAWAVVNNAVADGRLKRRPCAVCSATKVEAHHPDYSKPLEVTWLCRKHHKELHAREALNEVQHPVAMNDVQHDDSGETAEALNVDPRGAEPGDIEVLKDVQPNYSIELPKELPNKNKARKRAESSDVLGVSELISEGVAEQVAKDWLTLRKAKRLPLTPTAWDAVKEEGVKAGMTPAQAVHRAVQSNWAGFKSEWVAPTGSRGAGKATGGNQHGNFGNQDYRAGIGPDGSF